MEATEGYHNRISVVPKQRRKQESKSKKDDETARHKGSFKLDGYPSENANPTPAKTIRKEDKMKDLN